MSEKNPVVGIIMGSSNDWPVMRKAAEVLRDFSVPYEARVISAHRTPDYCMEYVAGAQARGLRVLIGGAGGAAHLPGVMAAKTTLPVLGVPIATTALNGMDSLYAIVQMPRGIPVATFTIGAAGAANAALFAVSVLAGNDESLAKALNDFRSRQAEKIINAPPLELD